MTNNHPEQPYLDLLKRIIDKGTFEENRTGIQCITLFGDQVKFSIKDSFPLITTKKMFFRGIVEELRWFLGGKTDNKILNEKGVHIWDGNSSRKFLDNKGLQRYEEGDCGPIYGFQWTHFGAHYRDCKTDYTNQGFNQIEYIIEEIKNNPTSRRIMMTAWNPIDMKDMCLPPCHVMVQFHVKQNKYLSCHMYQRSCDTFLGLPFNIASYALLTYLIAKKTNLIPDELIISFGNIHIYENHIDAVKEQLSREPHEWCTVSVDDPSTWEMDTITQEQIQLNNYTSNTPIKADMAC